MRRRELDRADHARRRRAASDEFGRSLSELLGSAGGRLEPARKRFERVLIGDHLCELSQPSCE